MTVSQIDGLREDMRRIERKVDDGNEQTRNGFDKVNGRLKRVELWRAKQEGRQSVVNSSTVNWQKIALALAKSIPIALGIAYIVVEWLLK